MTGKPLRLLFSAGLSGAIGVALAAVAAHKVQSPALASAAHLLMIHAAAAVAITAVAAADTRPSAWHLAAWLVLTGSILFAADITRLSFFGTRLFPYAAPLGGSTMIAGWLVVAGVALSRRVRGDSA